MGSRDKEGQKGSEEMASSIEKAVREGEPNEESLTNSEEEIERAKEIERKKKAKELRKKLRKQELGLMKYRWPAMILMITGFLAIWAEFLPVMTHPPDIGFDTFFEVYLMRGNIFFLFPMIAGILLLVIGYWAYTEPRATYLSIIPAMMLAMSAITIYFLISFALSVDPEADVAATGIPLTLIIYAVVALLSIPLREKE